ncbi:MAG: single-stranded-DNA-specific exonuclease RecJ [Solirubrobacterales bacterium]|nr:MAG: single-stranded-DNA-specific exonuclease RecJ [Solirubrobacterales bacterium]
MSRAVLPVAAIPAPARTPPLRAVPGPAAPAADRGPAPRLEVPAYDLAAALALERELGVGHVLSQVLVRRGLAEPAAARDFLDPREAHDPGRFDGIESAVNTIHSHVGAGSRITVHGDYDVDGICATAIMVRGLRALGANVGWFLPGRMQDGYGLSLATIERLAARGTRLLITVDCGITAVAEVAAAKAAGIDVVLSDHHSPRADGELPDCPIVHPATCGYPCPHLCGSAVAFKLAQALGAATADEDLDLVALATVADLVPLLGENRRLVRTGLRSFANTSKPGLRALMAVSRTDPSALDCGALGFRLAPRINAAGRLRRADAGLELLLTEDAERAEEIAAELDRVNGERRAIEQRIAWEAETQVSRLGERRAFVLAGEDWHPGVIGIVASRVAERHHRPAILIALDGAGAAGVAQGSGRSIPGFDLLAALHAASDHLERYGGHRAAAGLTVRRDRVDALRAVIEHHAERVLTPELLEPVQRVDAIVSGAELGLGLAEELVALEPCGIGNPGSRLLVPGARFGDLRPMGEGRHLRFSVSSGGARARAVSFGCDGRIAGAAGDPLDAVFRLERNVYKGAVEPRLVLRHAQPCSPGTIDAIGEPLEYLAAALRELDARCEPQGPEAACPDIPRPGAVSVARTAVDRRGESPLAVLADALAGGGEVLAVCADVSRRLAGLSARTGGFSLCGWHALEREPVLSSRFVQIVALDPPSSPSAEALLRAGSGFAHLAWGEAELRFAQQMHELEYGLRASLVALYRALRAAGRAAGEELERLLRGDGQHGRPARLAGRLIRVLAELELVSLDRDLPALAIASAAPTALERSPAYRVYAKRHEDGRRYLSSEKLRGSERGRR